MLASVRVAAAAGVLAALAATAAPAVAAPSRELNVAQIIERNATARGGVAAWRKIRTMAWTGRVEAAELPGHSMPFVLQQERPNKTRFELAMQGQHSLRIYNGTEGWKLRPASNGMPNLQPFTADELNFARDAQAIDGPLMEDVAMRGVITLSGIKEIEGRRAYVLGVTLPSGASHRVWVDAETFMETRFERDLRNAAGQAGIASVVYRNYKNFEGLQLPTIIETGATADKPGNKLLIEKIALNPPLAVSAFSKPGAPTRHHGVSVDTRGQPPAGALRPRSP
jgi:hypothetical protein